MRQMRYLISIFTIATMLFVAYPATKASAWTANPLPYTTPDGLEDWDWPNDIKNYNCLGSCTFVPWFDKDNSSYFIGFDKGDPNPDYSFKPGEKMVDGSGGTYFRTVWTMYLAPQGEKLKMIKRTDGHYQISATSSSVYRINMQSFFGQKVGGAVGLISVISAGNNATTSVLCPPSGYGNTCSMDKAFRAKNLLYDSSWDANKYNESIIYGTQAGTNCKAMEFGCWIGKAFDGVQDTLAGVAEAILRGLALLWIPSDGFMQAQFDELKTFFSEKLGFLSYPVEFFADLFAAFDGDGTWCSPSNCKWSFDVMYGGHANFDLLALNQFGWAPIWNYFLLFLRGTTIVGLMFMLHHKLVETMQK